MDLQKLKTEQERQGNLIERLEKTMNFQKRQEKLIDGLVKATQIQSLKEELEQQKKDAADKESRIQFLSTELESLATLVGQLYKQLNNQSLGVKLDSQGKLIDGHVQDSDKHNLRSHPPICSDAKSSGIQEVILPSFSGQPFKVACDAETQEGGWTIILRRMDGSENYRNWTEYKEGFGDLNGEFFLGLDKIHALTTERRQELLVVLEDFDGGTAFETYDDFAIGDEDQQYVLHTVGNGNGYAGGSLSAHRHYKFSTYDRDNDGDEKENFAEDYHGAWWYGEYYGRYDEM